MNNLPPHLEAGRMVMINQADYDRLQRQIEAAERLYDAASALGMPYGWEREYRQLQTAISEYYDAKKAT